LDVYLFLFCFVAQQAGRQATSELVELDHFTHKRMDDNLESGLRRDDKTDNDNEEEHRQK
jgi:hypothetical protein